MAPEFLFFFFFIIVRIERRGCFRVEVMFEAGILGQFSKHHSSLAR